MKFKPSLDAFPRFIRKHFVVIMSVVGGLVAIALAVAVILWGFWYRQWEGGFAERFARITHLPAARIDGMFVPYADYLTHLKAERAFLAGSVAKAQGLGDESPTAIKTLALNRAIRTQEVQLMAKQEGVVVTPLDAERMFQDLVARSASTTQPGEIASFLRENFGWDESDFKTYVLQPAMTEDAINKKYDTQGKAANSFTMQLNARVETGDVTRYLHF